jgi:hypothetical protein
MAEGWQTWEREVAELFGLDQTLASGSKFRDPGDAVQRGRGFPFPVLADAKYTEFASISFKLKFLRDWQDKAAEMGKRFVLPIRFHIKAENRNDDWVLISAHDLAELLDVVNERAT